MTPAALYLTRIAYLEARVDALEATVDELEATVDELEAAVSAAERDRQRVIDRYERLLREARRGERSTESDGPLGVSRVVADLLK